MSRILSVLALSLLSFGLCGFSGKLVIYGDEDMDGTEINTELAAVGFVEMSRAAQATATFSDHGGTCAAVTNWDMQDCRLSGEAQATHLGGECRSFTAFSEFPLGTIDNTACGTTGAEENDTNDDPCCGPETCVATCMADQPRQSGDGCLIMLGTEDAGTGADETWVDVEGGVLDDAIDSLRLMLSAADRNDLRCVVAVSFPRRQDSIGTWRGPNLRLLRDRMRQEIEERPRHLFFDTIALIDIYEAEKGTTNTDALYSDCPDCEHVDSTPNSLGESGFSWLGKRLARSLKGLALSVTVSVQPPNILFVIMDDLGYFGQNYLTDLATPNIDRLAAAGVDWRRAYAPGPSCRPARTAALFGLSPDTTGIYNSTGALDIRDPEFGLTDRVSLPQFYRDKGFRVLGSGKVFHDPQDDAPYTTWDEFTLAIDEATVDDDEIPGGVPANGITGLGGTDPNEDGTNYPLSWDFGFFEFNDGTPWSDDRTDETPDYERTTWGVDQIEDALNYPQPLFVSVGLLKPRPPFYCPKVFFDGLPDPVAMAPFLENDVADITDPMGAHLELRDDDLEAAEPPDWSNEKSRAYQACVEFADNQLGRLLDATDASSEPWLIMLWGDHGFQLKEKNRWHKFTLWDRGSMTHFILAGPGVPVGDDIDVPVSLTEVYATIADYAGMPVNPTQFDGASLRTVVDNPTADRVVRLKLVPSQEDRAEHTACKSEDWSFITNNETGTTEFYVLSTDPEEQDNVTADSQWDDEKAFLLANCQAPE